MALEMYAYRRVDVKRKEYQKPNEHLSVHIERGGKSLAGVQSDRIASVDEEVMHLTDANHIHAWFVDNVKPRGGERTYIVSVSALRSLLEVCERVLNASHLVREPAFKVMDWDAIRRRKESQGAPSMVIRNISVAYKVLPRRSFGFQDRGGYDEVYLKDVEATRDQCRPTNRLQ